MFRNGLWVFNVKVTLLQQQLPKAGQNTQQTLDKKTTILKNGETVEVKAKLNVYERNGVRDDQNGVRGMQSSR